MKQYGSIDIPCSLRLLLFTPFTSAQGTFWAMRTSQNIPELFENRSLRKPGDPARLARPLDHLHCQCPICWRLARRETKDCVPFIADEGRGGKEERSVFVLKMCLKAPPKTKTSDFGSDSAKSLFGVLPFNDQSEGNMKAYMYCTAVRVLRK